MAHLFEEAGCSQLYWLPDSGEFAIRGAFQATTLDSWLARIHEKDQASIIQLLDGLIRSGKREGALDFRANGRDASFEKFHLYVSRDENSRQPVLSGLVVPSESRKEGESTAAWVENLLNWAHHQDPSFIQPLRECVGAEAIALIEIETLTDAKVLALSIGDSEEKIDLSQESTLFSKLVRNEIDFGEKRYRNGEFATDYREFPTVYVQTSIDQSGKGFAFVGAYQTEEEVSRKEIASVASLLFERARREKTDAVRSNLESMLRHSERLTSMGRLTAGVAHDFSNLLTVIRGHTSFLEQEAIKNPDCKAQESITLIKEATEQAVSLAKQLLHFGRDQAVDFREHDLNEIVSNFVLLMRRMVEETVEIELNLDQTNANILADSGMIGQILMNLVVNARDAMSGKGKIEISTRLKEKNTSSGTGESKDAFILSVEDSGPGISPENLEKIFTPFYSTKAPSEGTGLGLSNVINLVKRHGAELEVSSQEGVGTKFEIQFPIRSRGIRKQPKTDLLTATSAPEEKSNPKSKPTSFTSRASEEEGSICGSKVLLVEDEASVRMLVKKLLEMHGCTVVEAASGRKALDLWPDVCDDISVVVSDIVMPEGVSGWDLAKELHLRAPDLGILLTSGYNEKPEDHGLGEDPKIAFLQKPYEAKKLKSNIFELLQKSAS